MENGKKVRKLTMTAMLVAVLSGACTGLVSAATLKALTGAEKNRIFRE